MKKLSLVFATVFAFSSLNASANTYEDISSVLVNAVATDLNQVRDTIQSQVQQSISDSISEFFDSESTVTEEKSSNEETRGE